MWPGCTRSSAVASFATAACTVRARSAAEMPVLIPVAASMETVKAVPWRVPLRAAMGGRRRRSQRSRVSVRQIRPRPKRAMKLTASADTWSAASTRSPSFSRSASSTRMTMRPAASSAVSSGPGEIAMRDCRRRPRAAVLTSRGQVEGRSRAGRDASCGNAACRLPRMSTSPLEQKWPQTVWIVRHGQSAGNLAREQAEAAGLHLIDIDTRDMDVPLSPLGERQADAVGHWFGRLPREAQPNVVLCSTYLRAVQTARRVLRAARIDEDDVTMVCDERLREKEFGILDRLTARGIRQKFPELSEQRRHVGKFYFRPPGGESWCDVILRLRSAIEMITREYRRERVLIVAHQVTVNCFRYLLERLR